MARKRKTAKPDLPPGAQQPAAASALGSKHQGRASPVPPPRQSAIATARGKGPQIQNQPLPAARAQQPTVSTGRNSDPQLQPFPAPRAQQRQQSPTWDAHNTGPLDEFIPAPPRQLQQPAASSTNNSRPQVHPPQVSPRQQPATSSGAKSGPKTQTAPSAPPQQPAASSAQDSNPGIIPPVFCCSSLHPTTPFTTAKDTKDRSAEFQKSLEKLNQGWEDQLKETPNPYTEKQIQVIKGNLVYCKWDLVHSKQAVEHHLNTHPDHEPDFKAFLTWASTASPPQKGGPGPYEHVIQVTQDLTYDPENPKLRNLTLRSRLYAPLPNSTSHCELPCGRDSQTPKPKKIELGNTMVCEQHKTRYFVCLYARNPPAGKFGGCDGKAIIQFEGGAGVYDVDVRAWFGRTGWGKGGLEGASFSQVGGVNCVRTGVRRGLGV